jgi:hypothetical protein
VSLNTKFEPSEARTVSSLTFSASTFSAPRMWKVWGAASMV